MPRADSGMTQITMPTKNRDVLKSFRLQIAAAIGIDFPMYVLIPVMVEICKRHKAETVELTRRQINETV
jgi:hypothetical protein